MNTDSKPVQYHQYLELDKILAAQHPISLERKRPAHDEMLFIITHQAYELWFKQLIFELDSINAFFAAPQLSETDMGVLHSRLSRMVEIIKLLIEQIRIIETMTPMDFLEFRDLLYPASGFQSFQFRLFEIKLGLKSDHRIAYNSSPYWKPLPEEQAQKLKTAESDLSLFDGLQSWLERTPFLSMAGFNFWDQYRSAVQDMMNADLTSLKQHVHQSPEDQTKMEAHVKASFSHFAGLFDESLFNQAREKGEWRLSYPAIHAALLIQLYRDQPIFQLPFRVLTSLLDLDELLTTWRYRHALMARRMLGSKVGTGGSSGYDYLRATSEKHRIFSDFFQLTTFFIPRSKLPELPESLKTHLDFYYNSKD